MSKIGIVVKASMDIYRRLGFIFVSLAESVTTSAQMRVGCCSTVVPLHSLNTLLGMVSYLIGYESCWYGTNERRLHGWERGMVYTSGHLPFNGCGIVSFSRLLLPLLVPAATILYSIITYRKTGLVLPSSLCNDLATTDGGLCCW